MNEQARQTHPEIRCEVNVGGESVILLTLRNDGTGSKEFGHYDAELSQLGGHVCRFRVENWHRGIGFEALVAYCLDFFVTVSEKFAKPGKDFVYGGEAPKSLGILGNIKLARVALIPPPPKPAAPDAASSCLEMSA